MKQQNLRWGTIESPFATFAAWVDGAGRVVRFNLSADGRRARRTRRGARRVGDRRRAPASRRSTAPASAPCSSSSSPPRGTEFQHAVWDALLTIPYGETRSYGEIARAIGQPQAARGVGAANGANPIGLIVPCHRVIGADGSLTGYGGGLPLKRALLAHEAAHRPPSARVGALF